MASLIADERGVAGLVCLGYPFHPPGKPDRLRTEHLRVLRTPTLICQGTRDPFGKRDEVAGYVLAPSIRLAWIAEGDHSFTPRGQSGRLGATGRRTWTRRQRSFSASSLRCEPSVLTAYGFATRIGCAEEPHTAGLQSGRDLLPGWSDARRIVALFDSDRHGLVKVLGFDARGAGDEPKSPAVRCAHQRPWRRSNPCFDAVGASPLC